MSNDAGYQSPKSNVPNAPVRVAGIAPTTVTKGMLLDKVLVKLIEQGKSIATQSFKAQNQLNLNELESEVLSELNQASSEAIGLQSPEEVESTFNDAVTSAQNRLDGLTGNNRQQLQVSLNKREGLLRAGQISPTVIGLKREQNLAKREATFRSDQQVLSNSSDLSLFSDVVDANARQISDGIAANVISTRGGGRSLRHNIDASATTMLRGMYGRGEHGLALSYIASDEFKNVSPDIRGQWSLKFVAARSNVTKGDILLELHDPHSDPNTNHWLTEEGLDELQGMREAVPPLLTENDFQTIVSQRKTMQGGIIRAGKDGKKVEAQNASIANMLAKRAACETSGRYDCATYSSMIPEDDKNHGELLNWAFSEDYKNHVELQINIGQPVLSDVEFMASWVQTNNKIPPVVFQNAINNIDLKVTPTAEEKEILIGQLNAISAIAKFAPAAFEDLVGTNLKAPGKTTIAFWRLFNVKQYGPDGEHHIEGMNIVRRLDASTAYDLASQELNAGFEAEVARRNQFEAAIMVEVDGVQVAETLAVEAWQRVTGTSATAADLGLGRITTITRRATAFSGNGGMNAKEAFAQAVRQLVTNEGHGYSTYNINDREVDGRIRVNAVDNPAFASINNTSVMHPNGTMLNFGLEPLRSDVVLDVISRLEMSLSLIQDNDIRDKGVILKELTAELASNTRFTTGHAWDISRLKEPGDKDWVRDEMFGRDPSFDIATNIDFNDPSQIGRGIKRIEGANTLKHVMQIWADRTGMELDDAYNLLSMAALGRENIDGNYWEPSLVGDALTRTGVTDRGGRNSPSWVVEAQYPDGALPVPITWGGAFTSLSPLRKDFALEPAGPGQLQTTGDYLFPMATVDGRIGGFTSVDGGDGKTYIIPTMVDGEDMDIQDALKYARSLGLEHYPDF
ncbi:MAG: hypothetical protein NZ777_16435, partial [Pseudomonadales bacterium]|nr:hypothetical protein [Pseudomonadales bacterium]